jgi:hypothetical protein
MLLASFVAGLIRVPGRQVGYANPQMLEQALKIVLSVQVAEKQEKFSESFYASFDNSVRLQSQSLSPTEHVLFLSSIDLHTDCFFQRMKHEALAIVCSTASSKWFLQFNSLWLGLHCTLP